LSANFPLYCIVLLCQTGGRTDRQTDRIVMAKTR